MKWTEKFKTWFGVPVLTTGRLTFAFGVALITDALQFMFGPMGWVVIDQGLDIIAMVLVSRAIGFHPLLLPTFMVEFLPVVDMLPTWTGCTAAVVVLRKRAEIPKPPPIQPKATVVEASAPPSPASPPPTPLPVSRQIAAPRNPEHQS